MMMLMLMILSCLLATHLKTTQIKIKKKNLEIHVKIYNKGQTIKKKKQDMSEIAYKVENKICINSGQKLTMYILHISFLFYFILK